MIKPVWFLIGLSLLHTGSASAHDYKQGPIAIGHPWARSTAEGVKTGAAYISLENTGAEADTFVSAESPVSEKTQIHETRREGDVMKMREIEGGVSLPAGTTVTFKPGGYHIMLLGLKQKLDEGQSIPLTLTFAKAGSIQVDVHVEKTAPNESSTMQDHGMH